jgi:hypothetical protein
MATPKSVMGLNRGIFEFVFARRKTSGDWDKILLFLDGGAGLVAFGGRASVRPNGWTLLIRESESQQISKGPMWLPEGLVFLCPFGNATLYWVDRRKMDKCFVGTSDRYSSSKGCVQSLVSQ